MDKKYVVSQLKPGEQIVHMAKISAVAIFTGFIPGLIALTKSELAITNKQIIGKKGLIRTQSICTTLDKVQNITVSSGLFGKIFGYSNIKITTAADSISFSYVKKAEEFKKAVFAQQEIYNDEKIKQQATQMASAMASAINK